MPRPAINDSLWAEMTSAQRSEAVRSGQATLRQMVAGLLDGPDELRRTCSEFLARTDASLKDLTDELAPSSYQSETEAHAAEQSVLVKALLPDSNGEKPPVARRKKRRLGLPRGYSPPLHRRNT